MPMCFNGTYCGFQNLCPVFLSVISFIATLVYFTPVPALLMRNEALSEHPPPISALLTPSVLEYHAQCG